MTLKEFIEKWTDKFCEVVGSANAVNQCVDLANAYIRDVLGLPIIEWTNAQDFPNKVDLNKYDYLMNTPEGVPDPGDLVIFKSADGVGHISIFVEGGDKSFRSFDQNYPTGSPCHIQGHYYTNVLGWLRPKGGAMDCTTVTFEHKDPDGDKIQNWTGPHYADEWYDEKVLKMAAEELVRIKDKEITTLSEEIALNKQQMSALELHYKEVEQSVREQNSNLAVRVATLEKEKVELLEAHTNLNTYKNELSKYAEEMKKENATLREQVNEVLVKTPSRTMLWILFKRFALRGGGIK